MKEVQATILDGILPDLLRPPHNNDLTSNDARPPHNLARTSSSQSVSRTQDMSIDRIANSVDGLHDTVAQLKSQFTALRIELNNPNNQSLGIDDDIIRHLLTELKAKADENAHLKLENDSLKLKGRVIGERQLRSSPAVYSPFLLEARSPSEMRSPGVSKEGGGRGIGWPGPWTGNQSTRYQAADSFDGDGDADLIEQAQAPLRGSSDTRDVLADELAPQDTTSLPVTLQFRTRHTMNGENDPGSQPQRQTASAAALDYEERATKRPRLTGPVPQPGPAPQQQSTNLNRSQDQVSQVTEERRGRGRPRTRGISTSRTEQAAPQPTTTVTAVNTAPEIPQTPDDNIDDAPPSPHTQQEQREQPQQEVEVHMATVTVPLVDNDGASNTAPTDKSSAITRNRSKRGRSRGPGRPPSSSSTATATQSAPLTRSAQKNSPINGHDANPSLNPATPATPSTSPGISNGTSDPNITHHISKQIKSAGNENTASTQNGGDESVLTKEQQLQKSTSRDLNGADANVNTREKRRSLIQARDNLAKMTMEKEEALALAGSDE